jgi:hypothetical protein
MMHGMRVLGTLGVLLCAGAAAGAGLEEQDAPAIDFATARLARIAHAVRVSERITLDGHLDEEAWQRVEPATNFVQWEPRPGALASEPTEVRFLFDDDNLYVGARCWDSDSARLTVHELREDFESREEDVFAIFIDSMHDLQSGFSFWTNPSGARRDVQIFQDDSQRSVDWDGVWDVKVTTDPKGWVAEFVIPFKTLRFSREPRQTWGLNMLRRVKRKNEDSYWSPLPRRIRTMRPSMSGTIDGFEGIRKGRNLKIKPYAIASATELAASGLARDFHRNAGVDLKYSPTASMTVDVTYRTDFSQVEADQQQVNLTRFNIVFPEKREFFLENTGVFAVGGSGPNGGTGAQNVYPFFSRRIGLSASGTPIPIVGGARLSGMTGPYDLGVLTMKTERFDDKPSNTFVVGRARRHLFGGSSVGAVVTSRDSPQTGDYNRLYGVDGLWRFLQNRLDVSSYLLVTDSPGREGRNQARFLEAAWSEDDYGFAARSEAVQTNFNPEVGFVRRRDSTHHAAEASWLPRPQHNARIRNYVLTLGTEVYEDPDGRLETRDEALTSGIAFQNSSALSFIVNDTFERLAKPFPLPSQSKVIVPAGEYQYQRAELDYSSNRGRALSGSVKVSAGEFWNGHSQVAEGGVELRPSYHLDMNLTVSRNQVYLPAGDFTTTLLGLRLLFAFTSKAFLNAFLQYNATTNDFSANTRFNIIHRPLSDLYVVYNEERNTVSGSIVARGVTVKFTNLFDF